MRILFPIAVFSLLLTVVGLGACSKRDPVADQYPDHRELRYVLTLHNTRHWALPETAVYIYLPASVTAYHHLLGYSMSGTSLGEHRLLQDSVGNNLLSLQLREVASGFSATVNLNVKVGFSASALEFSTPSIDNYLAVHNVGTEQIAGISFEKDDNLTVKVAKLLKAAGMEPAGHEGRSTVDIAGRFVGIARHAGLPARAVVGIHLSNLESIPLTMWVEVLDDNIWRQVDIDALRLMEDPEQYLGMRIFDDVSVLQDVSLSELLYESQGLRVSIGSIAIRE